MIAILIPGFSTLHFQAEPDGIVSVRFKDELSVPACIKVTFLLQALGPLSSLLTSSFALPLVLI
jgi:hypothetical protein